MRFLCNEYIEINEFEQALQVIQHVSCVEGPNNKNPMTSFLRTKVLLLQGNQEEALKNFAEMLSSSSNSGKIVLCPAEYMKNLLQMSLDKKLFGSFSIFFKFQSFFGFSYFFAKKRYSFAQEAYKLTLEKTSNSTFVEYKNAKPFFLIQYLQFVFSADIEKSESFFSQFVAEVNEDKAGISKENLAFCHGIVWNYAIDQYEVCCCFVSFQNPSFENYS